MNDQSQDDAALLALERLSRLPEKQQMLIRSIEAPDGVSAVDVHPDELREVLPFLERFGEAIALGGVLRDVQAALDTDGAPEESETDAPEEAGADGAVPDSEEAQPAGD